MTAWLYALIFGLAATLTYLVVAPASQSALVRQRALAIRRRRGRGERGDSPADEAMTLPFAQRVLGPMLERFYNWLLKHTPSRVKEQLLLQLNFAGNPMTPSHFVGLKTLFAVSLSMAALAMAAPFLGTKPAVGILMVIVFLALGWNLPRFWLARVTSLRRHKIDKALPDVLDLLSVSVEAGLGLDGAIQKVGEKFPEPTAGEFRELLKAIRLGTPRTEALRSLADRTGLPDVRTFTAAVIQAEQLGVSISRVLRVQSEGMRTKRRQRVEEQAMALPVKMLFPLIMFIFPSIFIVVLGPVVITFVTVFSKK